MIYPSSLEKNIEYFKKFPGVGERSAERLALYALEMKTDDVNDFATSLKNMKEKIKKCSVCGNLTEEEVCPICDDQYRDHNLICVLEDYKSFAAIEKAGNYNGVYHILDGLISPLDNIGPEDINIHGLISRVENLENPELIVALKSSVEGDATTSYIKKIFENKKVNISRLSYGIPMGAEIDYLDEVTLDRALKDRKIISD